MERRIKIIYIITIVSIIAFLGMQAYWLNSRYEYSITEYSTTVNEKIMAAIKAYRNYQSENKNIPTGDYKYNTRYSLSFNQDINKYDSPNSKIAHITTYVFDAHKLLSIPRNQQLTKEQEEEANNIALNIIKDLDYTDCTFKVDNAPKESDIWDAMRDFELEFYSPFTAEGLDSVLRREDITADITIATLDTMLWQNKFEHQKSLTSPHIRITSPFSALEKKVVIIDYDIPVSNVITIMMDTLILSIIISLLLILCLIWQISTIFKQNRLDKMRNDFVSTMIHELKRPIATLKMCVSGLNNQRMLENSETRDEILSDSRDALDSLSAYFTKLRDITFNNVEQIPLNATRFSVRDMLEDVIAKTHLPSCKSVEIKIIPDDDVTINADFIHLSNIMSNLIENSIKYSSDNVEIDIDYRITDNLATISVTDNGFGISAKDISHIFDKYYRVPSHNDVPGMGLGLTYIKMLVEAHNGTINVSSKPGQGSAFTITIPQT